VPRDPFMPKEGIVDYGENEGHVLNFVAGVVLGTIIGAGVALLAAPAKGKKTRKRLVRAAEGVRESAQDRFEDFADEVKGRVDDAVKVARKRITR